ncbi:MAG TPA: malate synthase A, partial [Ktedonobacteraceae bacterium]|nr:malate synthase A [Ktedonobacteraceae bacterium]
MTNQATTQYGDGIEVIAAIPSDFAEILTPEALNFVAKLARTFERRRQELLQLRVQRQTEVDVGKLPDFLPETEHIRQADWTIAPLPADLLDRRVELTGSADRKMIINGLNSGAKTFMADFEDAH